MNPDNPYAAPQTLEPQLAADEPLPVATLIGRQRYLETDTAALLRLAKLSRAIEAATNLWGFLLVNVICVTMFWGIIVRTFSGYFVLLLLLDAVVIYRLVADAARRTYDRIFIALADGLVLATLVYLSIVGIVSLRRAPGWEYVILMLLLGLLVWILVRSIRATLSAQVLFGRTPYLHGELAAEVEYRRANQIA